MTVKLREKEFRMHWSTIPIIIGALAGLCAVLDSATFHFVIEPWATHDEIQRLEKDMAELKKMKIADHKLLLQICAKEGIPVPDEIESKELALVGK